MTSAQITTFCLLLMAFIVPMPGARDCFDEFRGVGLRTTARNINQSGAVIIPVKPTK
jgi:hypothetical protein